MLSDSVLRYTGSSEVEEDEVGCELVGVGICWLYTSVIRVLRARGSCMAVEDEVEEPRRLE